MSTRRVTITVDSDVLDEGHRTARRGGHSSFSEWATAALADRIERDNRVAALAAAVADFENECGAITAEDVSEQRRLDDLRAIAVRDGQIVRDGRQARERATA
jgi:hypothetical protein